MTVIFTPLPAYPLSSSIPDVEWLRVCNADLPTEE